LWIVESIPFQTAYSNAHFPVATAIFLSLIILIISERTPLWKRIIGTISLSTLLAIVQPFSFFALFVVLLVWILWETWLEISQHRLLNWKSEIGRKWLTYIAMLASALPWLIYDFWLTQDHAQIAAWNAQNITPSPPLIEFILGFGAPLIVAIIGLIKTDFRAKKTDRLLLVWCVLQGLMIYAPLGLQRRFSHGLYFALVPVALLTLERLVRNTKTLRLAIIVLVFLSIPSNMIVVGSGLFAVGKQDPAVVLSVEEYEAYQWLASNTETNRIILAGPTAGNRIPAFTNLKVIYGHPFETIDAENQLSLVESAFSSDIAPDDGIQPIFDLGITYVFFGPEEKTYGEPDWLAEQVLVFSAGDYAIYEMSNQ
jgi:hypothetical protein